MTGEHEHISQPVSEPETPQWHRLNPRMIWVDLAQSILAMLPAVLGIFVFGVTTETGGLWPLIGIAAFGVFGAISDALRWVFTRYRITDTHVEVKTGVLVRVARSIQRDRIRSVDVEARLRHRLARLRVVKIGAGQQKAAGESALALDAVGLDDAHALQRALLAGAPATRATAAPDIPGSVDTGFAARVDAESPNDTARAQVFATFTPRWVVYNIFSGWAFLAAIGIVWGGYWLLVSVGVQADDAITGAVDWETLGLLSMLLVIAAGIALLGIIGMIVLALSYFAEYWNFELARVPGPEGTFLRTRKGLFTTREVNRDDNRMRGIYLSEPLIWRWLGVADLSVITTGLSIWSSSQPASILPRAPLNFARRVAEDVLDGRPQRASGDDPRTEHPLRAPLRAHPRAALRRRIMWASTIPAVIAAVLGWLAVTAVLPVEILWLAVAVWPVAVAGAVLAYRSLGHTISGAYLVTRSGLSARTTAVLKRSAVSTVAIRESPLQRRLGLQTVSVMTAAGYGTYQTPDVSRDSAVDFALAAAPGLLDPFVVGAERSRDLLA